MRESSIRKITSLEKYEAPKLDLEKRKRYSVMEYTSCGSAALSLITGIRPSTVERFCPNPRVGWYTSRAIKYLKEKGYTVLELSKEDVLKGHWSTFPLNQRHCLLMSVRMNNEENSMFVLHNGILWHNFESEPYYNGLFFLNKPTQDVLLIFKKSWR